MSVIADPLPVSIVMPIFNGSRYLGAALDSLLGQGGPLFEVLVIDDGSTDDSYAIAAEYASRLPIRFLDVPRSGNWVANTNLGIRESKGEFIGILHQDDRWERDRLRLFCETLRSQRSVDVFVNHSSFIDQFGKPIGRQHIPLPLDSMIPGETVLQTLIVQNFISVPGVIFRRSLLSRLPGLMDEGLWYTADWKLWLSLCPSSQWFIHSQFLTQFRIHPDSLTVKGLTDEHYRKQLFSVLDDFLPVLKELKPLDYENLSRRSHFSQEVNYCLAASFSGKAALLLKLLKESLKLGPKNLMKYFTESRIFERILPRLRLLFR